MKQIPTPRTQVLFASAALIALAIANPAPAALQVTDWDLETAVQDLSLGGGQDVAFSFTVTNPFDVLQAAQLGPGTAMTSYDLSWSGDNASFRIDMAHVTPDLHNSTYSSFSQGSISFSTTEPLIAHLTASYAYSMPVGGMTAGTSFRVIRLGVPGITYLNDGHFDDTILSPAPLTGQFTSDQTAVLPPGTYGINYTARITASGNTGALASGSGFFQFTLNPIPEPVTLTLSSVAIALCIRRSRCRSHKTTHARASTPIRHSVPT